MFHKQQAGRSMVEILPIPHKTSTNELMKHTRQNLIQKKE
mgnify:CR=1 FL=1